VKFSFIIWHQQTKTITNKCGDFSVKKFFLIFIVFSSALAYVYSADAMVLYNMGRNLERNGRVEESHIQYNNAVAQCLNEVASNIPNNKKMDAYSIASWCLINLKRYNDVLKYSKDAFKIDSEDHRIIEAVAEAYFYLGKHAESLKLFQKYVNIPGIYRLGIAYFFIGEIYEKMGKYSKAEMAYLVAVRNTDYRDNPKIAFWWFKLATTKEKLMDKTIAQDRQNVLVAYSQVLRFSAKYPGVKEKIREIQAMR